MQGFLSNIQQYRPLETGHALAWVAVPMFAVVWLVALIVIYTHSRLILALGFTIVAFGCWIFAHLDSRGPGLASKPWKFFSPVALRAHLLA